MAKLQTELRLNKAFIKECVGLFAEGKLDAATASMAKVAATEAQCKMADECLQLFKGLWIYERISNFKSICRCQDSKDLWWHI